MRGLDPRKSAHVRLSIGPEYREVFGMKCEVCLLRQHRAATKKVKTYGSTWLKHVQENGRVYLLYAVAGESGIAIAEVFFGPVAGGLR